VDDSDSRPLNKVAADRVGSRNFIAETFATEHRPARPMVKAAQSTVMDNPDVIRALRKSAWEEDRVDGEAARAAHVKLQNDLMRLRDDMAVGLSHVPFHRMEVAIHQQMPKSSAAPLCSLLWEMAGEGHNQRRASDAELANSFRTVVDMRGGPMASVERLVASTTDFFKKATAARRSRQKKIALLGEDRADRPIKQAAAVNSFEEMVPETARFFKQAVMESTREVAGLIRGGIANLSGGPVYRGELERALEEVDSPDVRDRVKQVTIRSTLNDLLVNDPVIKGYDPEEVVEFFNELVRLQPAIADQPAVLRGLLRRSLQQGQIEPFEAGQAVSIGNDINAGRVVPENTMLGRWLEETKLKDQVPSAEAQGFRARLLGVVDGSAATRGMTFEQKVALKEMAQREGIASKDRASRESQAAMSDRSAGSDRAQRAEQFDADRELQLAQRGDQTSQFERQLAAGETLRDDQLSQYERTQELRDMQHWDQQDQFGRSFGLDKQRREDQLSQFSIDSNLEAQKRTDQVGQFGVTQTLKEKERSDKIQQSSRDYEQKERVRDDAAARFNKEKALRDAQTIASRTSAAMGQFTLAENAAKAGVPSPHDSRNAFNAYAP
jgi:hypothetical protein